MTGILVRGSSSGAERLPFPRVLVAIAGIYTAQSLVGGLTFQGIPVILRDRGVALDMIGLVSVVMLPWALKFLWAPMVERYRLPIGTRRRSRRVILVGEAIVAAVLLALAVLGPDRHAVLLLILGIVALSSATVDIACDAFAIEQLHPLQRGWGNTAQVGGGYFGMVFGSGLFVVIVAFAGWAPAAIVMAALVLCLAIPFMLLREPARPASTGLPHRPNLRFAFSRPEVRCGLLLTMLFELGVRLAQGMGGPFLVDAGLDLALIGALTGVGGTVAGLAGTFAGGLLVRRLGARRAILAGAAAQAIALAGLTAVVLAGSTSHVLLAGLFILLSVAMATGFVTLYSLLMGLASPLQAGVDFTLFQCADAFIAGLCGFAAGAIAQRFGYGICFSLAALAAVTVVLAMPVLLRRLPPSDYVKETHS
ncbi:MFS transporter [Pseudochelatococcus sp. B33]